MDDHGAVDDRFGSDSVGLGGLLAWIEEWSSFLECSNHGDGWKRSIFEIDVRLSVLAEFGQFVGVVIDR